MSAGIGVSTGVTVWAAASPATYWRRVLLSVVHVNIFNNNVKIEKSGWLILEEIPD